VLHGIALALAADGRLEVRPEPSIGGGADADRKIVSVSAGDVTHLRY
jgi:hypothetical protein